MAAGTSCRRVEGLRAPPFRCFFKEKASALARRGKAGIKRAGRVFDDWRGAEAAGRAGRGESAPGHQDPARFENLSRVFLAREGEYAPCEVESSRLSGDMAYLKLAGVDDRGAAEKLRGEFLYIDRENALELGEDENFIVDLLGCRATDTDGREIGTLTDVMQPGGNDVYVFEGPLGEVLVPALKSVVLRVDAREKTILLDAKRLSEVAVFDED